MNEIILKGEKSQSVADTSTAAETNPPVINITNNNTHHVSNVSNNTRNLTQVSNVNSTSNILNQVANINHTSNALTQVSSVSDNYDNRIFNQVSNPNNNVTSIRTMNQINNSNILNHHSKDYENNGLNQFAIDQHLLELPHTSRSALLPAIDTNSAPISLAPAVVETSNCRDLAVVPSATDNLRVGTLNTHLAICAPGIATDASSHELTVIPSAILSPISPRTQCTCQFAPLTKYLDLGGTRRKKFKCMKSIAEKEERTRIILKRHRLKHKSEDEDNALRMQR